MYKLIIQRGGHSYAYLVEKKGIQEVQQAIEGKRDFVKIEDKDNITMIPSTFLLNSIIKFTLK